MAKFKLDPKQAKEFVVKHYEVVALFAGAVVAVLCLVAGVISFLGASSPDGDILAQAKKIDAQRTSSPPPEASKDAKADLPLSKWPLIGPKDARLPLYRPFFDDGAAGDNRRFMPKIFALDNDPKAFQMDYLRRGVFVYTPPDASKKLMVFQDAAAPGVLDPIFQVADKRLVVVSATFPYYLQSEEFKKALRFDDLREMFAQGLAPAFEGLIVERRKITAQDGKEAIGEWEPVYWVDRETGKTQASPAIVKLLGTCIYDVAQVEKYADVIFGASVTPLPVLAGGKGDYPDIKIPAIAKAMTFAPSPAGPASPAGPGSLKPPGGGSTTKGEPGMKGGMSGPGMQGEGSKLAVGRSRQQFYPTNAAQERKTSAVEFDTLPKDLQDQLSGNVNWTSPYGTFVDEPQPDDGKDPAEKGGEENKSSTPKGKQGGMTTGPGGVGIGGGLTPNDLGGNLKAPTVPPTNPKALVRFVDTDVVPGAQYQYRVAVRIANPNYNLSTKLVANAGWTKAKDLVSDWVETPRIAIPEEYHFYVINQVSGFASKLVPNSNPNKNVTNDGGTLPQAHQGERVPFQIHKFMGNFTDNDGVHYMSDWEIAERVLVGKGEALGREVLIEAIQWNWGKGQFEIAGSSRGAKQKVQTAFGVPVDFRPSQPIILLDYVGGQVKYTAKAGTAVLDATCATEALMLMPDGSMIVRNSRHDMDDRGYDKADADLGGHRLGMERRHRYEEWRSQLEEFRDAAQKANMPTMPKGPKNGN